MKPLLESRRSSYLRPWEGRLHVLSGRLQAGIDIGTHSIKCAVVDGSSGQVRQLWRAEMMPQRKAATALEGEARRERVTELLADWVHQAPTGVRVVRSAVQGDDTVCRLLEFPPLRASELEVAVPSMMRKFLPCPLDQVVLRWEQVPALRPEGDKTTVFAVAARRTLVEDLNVLLSTCQAEPQQVNALPLALIREMQQNHAATPGRFRALLHLGFSQSTLVLERDGYPYYVRHFWPALRDFTDTLATEMGVPWPAAERVLVEMTLQPRAGALEPTVQRWMAEVGRTLEFCRHRLADVDDVLLSGGGSALRGLPERLSAELDRPVLADWWDLVTVTDTSFPLTAAGIFKPAVGMALQP